MEKKKNSLIRVLFILCAVSVITMFAVLLFTKEQSEEIVFTPPAFDTNAVQGSPEVPKDLGWNEIDAQVYKASICGMVRLEGNKSDVWLTNPKDNTVWLKLRVLDENGEILSETGLICPGEYLQTISFDKIPKNGDSVILKLMAYEPETYYSAGSVMLNTTVVEGGK